MRDGTLIGEGGFLRAAAGKTLAETSKTQIYAGQSEAVLRVLIEHRAHILESIAHAVHEHQGDPELGTGLRATVSEPNIEARINLSPRSNEIEFWIQALPKQPWLHPKLQDASSEDWPGLQRGLEVAVAKVGDELSSAFGAQPRSISSVHSGIVIKFDVPGLKEAIESARHRV